MVAVKVEQMGSSMAAWRVLCLVALWDGLKAVLMETKWDLLRVEQLVV
jgi:hypothetical protein